MPDRYVGRYQIVRMLGRGGMGDAYLARDLHIDRQVVINTKVFRPRGAGGRRPQHPNVVTVLTWASTADARSSRK